MPFEALAIVPKVKPHSRASISYMRHTHEGSKLRPPPKLIVGIPRGILGTFKPKKDALYEFHVGTGKDVGKARIVAGKDGVAPSIMKYFVAFRFGFVPTLGEDIADKEFVDSRPVDGGFEIDLPAWFK